MHVYAYVYIHTHATQTHTTPFSSIECVLKYRMCSLYIHAHATQTHTTPFSPPARPRLLSTDTLPAQMSSTLENTFYTTEHILYYKTHSVSENTFCTIV